MKLLPVCILESNELIMIDERGSLYTFCPVTQDRIDEMNTVEYLKENYGYVYEESGSDQTEEEYFEGWIETEVNYGSKHFVTQDDSYIHMIDDSIKDDFGYEVITFECTGSGGGIYLGMKPTKIYEHKILGELISDLKKRARAKKEQKKLEAALEKVKATKHWSGLMVITGGAA